MSYFSMWIAAVMSLLGQNLEHQPSQNQAAVTSIATITTTDVSNVPASDYSVHVERSNGRLCVSANGRSCIAKDASDLRRKDPELYDAYITTLEQANELAADMDQVEAELKRELSRIDSATIDTSWEFTRPAFPKPTDASYSALRFERHGGSLAAAGIVREEFSRSVSVDADGKVTVQTNDNGHVTTEKFRSTRELKQTAPEIHRSLDLQVP